MLLITVITVSYNAAKIIEKTILSVINQTYPNIEYIIIDGGSTDGTVDIIKKYSDKISYWVSEPDKGIYDAMNKGIGRASGEWINFMNAGDWFYSEGVLEKIFSSDAYCSDIIYGAVERRTSSKCYIDTPLPINHIIRKMVFSHQSTFVQSKILKESPFDGLTYPIIADYAFFIKQFQVNATFQALDIVVSSYDNVSGISSSPSYKLYKKHLLELMKLRKEFNLGAKYYNFLFPILCLRFRLKKFMQNFFCH